MERVMNLNAKRVCDLSPDKKAVYIQRGDCMTIIRIGKDGKFVVSHKRIVPQA